MKSVAKTMMNSKKLSKKKSNDEKKVLIANNDAKKYSEKGMPRSRNTSESSLVSASSPHMARRTMSNSSAENNGDLPMVNVRSGSRFSPPPSPTIKVSASMDLDFAKVPFQFYSRDNTSWLSSIGQALCIIFICLLTPCLIVALIMFINKKRLRYKGRMSKADKEKQGRYLLMLFLITLLKDLMIITIILDSVYDTPVSKYEIAYAPVVFIWTLIFFIFPLSSFLLGDTRYVFGFDSDKKNLLETFSQITSLKVKEEEIKKVDDQEKYFIDKYKLLSNIKAASEEIKFLKESTSKVFFKFAGALIIVACIIHAFIPMFLQLIECTFCKPEPYVMFLNKTYYNATVNKNATIVTNKTIIVTPDKPYIVYTVVLALSTFNSFLVSLFASLYFVFVTLWKFALLKEWKRFNSNETDTSTTLINGGPQGIAMWWKIRQTLKLYSTSSLSMSVMIGKMQCVVNFICIACLSITLILLTRDTSVDIHSHALIPLLVDNILLYAALLIIACLSILIDKEQSISSHLIQLKQLNVFYELGRYMNMETESMNLEPGIRVKVRVMRGCSVLLQELTSAMDKLEKSTSSYLNISCFVLATILMIPSLFMSFRYISHM